MTRKTVTALFAAMLLLASAAFAAGQPSAKATASVGKVNFLKAADPSGATLMTNTVKTASGTDLFVDVSMECGLFTSTKVDSLGGIEDRAEAMAGVEVTVLVDGLEALPGPVTFCRRSQVLTAEFQGLLQDEDGNVCLTEDLDNPGTLILDEDCLRPETLEMALDTMGSHSFNFIAPNLSSGVHTVQVRAMIDTYMDSTLDSGAKVRDKDIFGDTEESFQVADTVLTVDKGNKFEVGQIIVIDDEKLRIQAIQDGGVDDPSGKELVVTRGWDGTADATHARDTRIYIVEGADATATIGNGSVTVEAVRMIQGEQIDFEN